MSSASEWPVLIRKTEAMRELQRRASRGQPRWVAGKVEPRKAEGMVLKFIDRYGVAESSQQRWRRKKRGEATASLVLWWPKSGPVYWWLMVSPGEGVIEQLESVQDARKKKQRLQMPGEDYELVQLPQKGGDPTWTWRMTAGNREGWAERMRTVVRRGDTHGLAQAIYSLVRSPGFRGVRSDAMRIYQDARRDWERVHRRSTPWPYAERLGIGWLGRYRAPQTIALGAVVRRARKRSSTQPSLAEGGQDEER